MKYPKEPIFFVKWLNCMYVGIYKVTDTEVIFKYHKGDKMRHSKRRGDKFRLGRQWGDINNIVEVKTWETY